MKTPSQTLVSFSILKKGPINNFATHDRSSFMHSDILRSVTLPFTLKKIYTPRNLYFVLPPKAQFMYSILFCLKKKTFFLAPISN